MAERSGRALLRWSRAPQYDPRVLDAVKQAFGVVGLPQQEYRAEFPLPQTGKLGELIWHTAYVLNRQHPVATVKDVWELF